MNRARWIGIGVLSAAWAMAACSPQADAPPGGDDAHREAAAALHAVPEGVLSASAGAVGDKLGHAVDISGDTAILGAAFGARAVVFTRSGGTWTEQEDLILPSPCDFGCSVAIEADTALVGVPGAPGGGVVLVYTRSGVDWTQAQVLTPEPGDGGQFGLAVAMQGDTAVVGARTNPPAGSAVVYVRDGGGTWQRDAKLPGVALLDGSCGEGVALSGDTLLVGCNESDGGEGAAYVHVRSGGMWTEQARLTGNDVAPLRFGSNVALSGDIAAIGSSTGTYVLARSGGAWTHEKKIATFGAELSGEALFSRNNTALKAFLREGGAWSEAMSELLPSTITAIAVDGTTVVAGTSSYSMGKGAGHAFSLELDKGDACGPVAPCVGGFCVDGVCCDTECGGGDPNDCMACSVAAGGLKDGVCGPLACDDGDACTQTDILDCSDGTCVGSDEVMCPKPELACAIAGVCDALTGVCSSPDTSSCVDAMTCAAAVPGTLCAPSSCAGADAPTKGLGAAYCAEGQDACPVDESVPFDCSPFACEPATGTCRASCTSASHCAPGLVCGSAGACVPRPPSKVGDAGGCACRAAGAGEPGGFAAWLGAALAAVSFGLSRSGRRARGAEEQGPEAKRRAA